MSDIFKEINKELRQEAWRGLFKRYRLYAGLVVGGAILCIVTIFLWQSSYESTQEETSRAFMQGVSDFRAEETSKALLAFEKLAEEGHDGYASLALLYSATINSAQKNYDASLAVYRRLLEDTATPEYLADYATVSAGLVLAQVGNKESSHEDLYKSLETLASSDKTMASTAKFVLALIAYQDKKVVRGTPVSKRSLTR